MASKNLVTKVWIEPGCIVCDACEDTAPTVFEVTDDTCIIRPAALDAEFTKPITDLIIAAAEECPVNVIKYDSAPFEVPDAPAAPAAPPEPAAEPAAAAATAASEPAAQAAPAAPKAAAPKPAAAQRPAAKASPEAPIDPTLRKMLETSTSRGGVAGRDKAAALSTARLYKESPAAKLPPDAKFMRMVEAGRQAATDAGAPVTRRDVVKLTAWTTFTAATALGTYGCGVRFMFPNVLNEPEKRIRVAAMEKFREMAPGGVNEEWKPKGIWIVRVEDRIAALSTTCTHLGCIPSWLEADRKFKCPCHGSGFKQNGINFEGAAPRPLERYRVSVEDGWLIVDKSRKFQYEKGEWENPDSYIVV